MSMIFVVDDDAVMRRCVTRACGETEVLEFSNAIEAMVAIDEGKVPDLIFLDILLDGPDGFTFLNELVSYADLGRVPVVVVSSLDFSGRDLGVYDVVGVLNKETMRPEEVWGYVLKYAAATDSRGGEHGRE